MPVRNVVRTPRRTLLTALAIGAAITAMVATIGIVDTFVRTLDVGEAELGGDAPDRLSVELDSFYPVDAPEVAALADSSLVATAEPRLRLFGTIASGDVSIDVLVDLVDFDRASWTPTLLEGDADAVEAGGLVLSRKAVDDLGLDVGDELAFRHPERVGLGYRLVTSSVPIAGVDPNPVRNLAYLDLGQASLFELEGITNVVDVRPAAGSSEDDVKRALFGTPGVASVEGVTTTIRLFRDALASFFGILRVAEAIVLLLALLIAFNSTSISIDERAREHATMLAFGLPPRVVLAMVTLESVITGLLGTALGVLAGRGVLQWMTAVQLDDTMPDLGVVAFVSTGTIATAFVLGVVAVGAAPLLAGRRVRHVDIPSTLRVLE
jgi:putative ABC transport system permease protein